MKGDDQGEPLFDAAESKTPSMWGNSLHGNREKSRNFLGRWRRGTVGQGSSPNSRRARDWGVGRSHSAREAGEQSRPDGGGGAREGKGIDQGERARDDRGPDPEPDHRVERLVARYGKQPVGIRRCGSPRCCTT